MVSLFDCLKCKQDDAIAFVLVQNKAFGARIVPNTLCHYEALEKLFCWRICKGCCVNHVVNLRISKVKKGVVLRLKSPHFVGLLAKM